MPQAGIAELSDQAVILVLQELGQELPVSEGIGSEDEARLAVASVLPSGEKATDWTASVCPVSGLSSARGRSTSVTSHSVTA